MEASAIRIDVKELVKLERAAPPVAILTATIKFQLTGKLTILEDEGLSQEKKEQKIGKMLLEALRHVYL